MSVCTKLGRNRNVERSLVVTGKVMLCVKLSNKITDVRTYGCIDRNNRHV